LWALARQQAAFSAAATRQQKLLQKADTDAKRLAAADSILARGDIRVAGLIYARLGSTRSPTPSTEAAKLRLTQLQKQAQAKLDELDRLLASGGAYATGGDSTSHGTFDQPVDWHAEASSEIDRHIMVTFREYEEFVDQYGGLPGVGTKIEAHVAKLRCQPVYAAVLNEPMAKKLWTLGQKHERDDQLCCAYWVYKEAAELKPALSASRAANRFAELAQDPQVVASAETCRALKWCHGAYLRAEKLLIARPEKAKEVFAEIVARAPEDSEVYRAAKKQIEEP
jgi:hypothetical protein